MSSKLHDGITSQIVEALEQGTAPWVKPWSIQLPVNAISKKAYNGVNILLLWMQTNEQAYKQNTWLTFNQAKELGGSIKKGEKSTRIIYTATAKKKQSQASANEEDESYRFLKSYSVFNIEQTEGLPAELFKALKPINSEDINPKLETFIQTLNADLRYGGDRAFYRPSEDYIQLPSRDRFKSQSDYYATSLHEHAHWSGHKDRLGRDLTGRFGSEAYAAEELIAELAGAFLCAEHQVRGKLMHAEYIASWLKILKEDKQAIFTAASKASKIVHYFNEQISS